MIFIVLLAAIALQIFLAAKKVSPVISLLLVSVLAGFALGLSPSGVIAAIEKGVASTLGGLLLILALGAMLGAILERSGAAKRIADSLVSAFGLKHLHWAIMLTGFLVGLPLYYNAGFVLLVPLIFVLARQTALPLMRLALPMAAALSTTHCFLPPHPGPVVLVNAFNASTAQVLLLGIAIAIPAVLVAGPLLSRLLFNVHISENETDIPPDDGLMDSQPPVITSFVVALLPILLIALDVINSFLSKPLAILSFVGEPVIALLISVLIGVWLLGIQRNTKMSSIVPWLHKGIESVAVIILIITAGGVFRQVLLDSGAASYISQMSSQWNIPPLLFGWLVTALLRICVGSATVSGLTAAGIVLPLVQSGQANAALMVLAVGSGSVFGSHINDSGFWMFKEYLGLTLKQTFLSWTIMESMISVIGLLGTLLLNTII